MEAYATNCGVVASGTFCRNPRDRTTTPAIITILYLSLHAHFTRPSCLYFLCIMNGFAPQAAIWKEAKAPDGRVYYYNTQTKATTWTKPQEMMAPVDVRPSNLMIYHLLTLLRPHPLQLLGKSINIMAGSIGTIRTLTLLLGTCQKS
jgi:WW domain-containing protein